MNARRAPKRGETTSPTTEPCDGLAVGLARRRQASAATGIMGGSPQ